MSKYFDKISYLMLETNSACNLHCTGCNRDKLVEMGKRTPKTLSNTELRQLLDRLKDCPIDTIKLQGLSEPMLNQDFSEQLVIIREYFPKAFLIMATNCQYYVDKSPFYLSLKHVDMVYLSISGIAENYEKFHRGGSYQKIIDFLESIYKKIHVIDRAKKIFINFVASEDNYKDLPQIYQLKEKYKLAGVRINLEQNWSGDEKNRNSYGPSFLNTLKKYQKDVMGVSSWEYRDCFWPYTGLYIDVYGDIRPCIINTSHDPVTNIFKEDCAEKYNNSEIFSDIRCQLSNNKAVPACINCDYHHLSHILQRIHLDNKRAPRGFVKI